MTGELSRGGSVRYGIAGESAAGLGRDVNIAASGQSGKPVIRDDGIFPGQGQPKWRHAIIIVNGSIRHRKVVGVDLQNGVRSAGTTVNAAVNCGVVVLELVVPGPRLAQLRIRIVFNGTVVEGIVDVLISKHRNTGASVVEYNTVVESVVLRDIGDAYAVVIAATIFDGCAINGVMAGPLQFKRPPISATRINIYL